MDSLGSGGASTYVQFGYSVVCYYKPVYMGGGDCEYILMPNCNVACATPTQDVYVGGPPCPPVEMKPYILFWTVGMGSRGCISLLDAEVPNPACTCSQSGPPGM